MSTEYIEECIEQLKDIAEERFGLVLKVDPGRDTLMFVRRDDEARTVAWLESPSLEFKPDLIEVDENELAEVMGESAFTVEFELDGEADGEV